MAKVIVCTEHWEALRVLVCEHGLGHLLHQPHDEFEAFAAELCGRPVRQYAFDPLVRAREVAEHLAVSYGGSYLMNDSPAGTSRCPICELVEHFPTENTDPDRYWSESVVHTVESQARASGLMPRVA